MIIYSVYGGYIGAIDVETRAASITNDIDGFFESHNKDFFVTYNGEKEKKRYPNAVIFSSNPNESFEAYCAENGLNCETDNRPEARASYNVYILMKYYETIIKPRFDLYTAVIRGYHLKPYCYRYTLNQLTREALGWK